MVVFLILISNSQIQQWQSIKINLMQEERKRMKSLNDFILAYEDTTSMIMSRYENEIGKFTEDSIGALSTLFHSYLSKKQLITESCQNTKAQSTQQSSIKNIQVGSHKIYEEDLFCPSTIRKKSSLPEKKNEEKIENIVLPKQQTTKQLAEEYGIDFDDEFFEEKPATIQKHDEEIEKVENKPVLENIKDIQNRAKEEKQHKQKENVIEQDPESEYQMTDYSSNESSNEGGSYSAHYNDEEADQPLFGGLFTKTASGSSSNSSSSTTNFLNFNFSSKELLKSPKKSPKKKRLYVGNKKIPRWAQNLEQVEKYCQAHPIKTEEVFGICIVENLNTNLIFREQTQKIERTSSAKWNRRRDPQTFIS